MQKKLTITIDEKVYEGLYRVVGARRISNFIERLVRPHVIDSDLEAAYLDPRHAAEPRDAPALAALPFLSLLAVEPPAWHGEAAPRHEQRKAKNAD